MLPVNNEPVPWKGSYAAPNSHVKKLVLKADGPDPAGSRGLNTSTVCAYLGCKPKICV